MSPATEAPWKALPVTSAPIPEYLISLHCKRPGPQQSRRRRVRREGIDFKREEGCSPSCPLAGKSKSKARALSMLRWKSFWDLVSDFSNVAHWHPDVTECRLESGSRKQ